MSDTETQASNDDEDLIAQYLDIEQNPAILF